MKVMIKTLYAEIELKKNGMELQVRSLDDDAQLGDCYVTMVGLVWCKGKITKKNGIQVPWQEFMEICWSKDTYRAALSAAKTAKAAKEKKATNTVASTTAPKST